MNKLPSVPAIWWLAAAAVAAITAGAITPATAQDYPTRPVRMIIPFPPGGSNDVVGRLIATHLGDRLGKQVVVDNRSGAGGVIGTEFAAKSPPDGYTLLVISIAHAVNPWLYKLAYDPIKDFSPVGLLARGANVLVVHPSLPVGSVKELIDLAKSKPGDLPYASAGIGSFEHVGGELFKLMAGVDLLHVPFRGGGPALVDTVGGHTKVMFSSLVQTVPQIHDGKLRALGTGGPMRSPVLPDVPTISEAGVPGYEAVNWWGVAAPAATPPAIVDRLSREIEAVQKSDDVQKQLALQGAEAVVMKPAEFGAYIVSEMNKWEKVVKQGGIKAE
jgi:tripartite-type tricarboxylate transporter receptor subunit TctC